MTHAEDVHNARQWGGYASKADAEKRLASARAEVETWQDTLRERTRLAEEMGTGRALAYATIAEVRLQHALEIVRLWQDVVSL
jgi:hypothetical protein